MKKEVVHLTFACRNECIHKRMNGNGNGKAEEDDVHVLGN